MLRVAVLAAVFLCTACTQADREAMFSARQAPLIRKCDEQPGYPPVHTRPGCEYEAVSNRGK